MIYFRNKNMPGKVVFAMTNHADMGNTGKKTGYFLPEVAHPWQVLKEAGFEVVYVSPKGGASPLVGCIKTCVERPLIEEVMWSLKTDDSLMQLKSNAESSCGSFLQYL